MHKIVAINQIIFYVHYNKISEDVDWKGSQKWRSICRQGAMIFEKSDSRLKMTRSWRGARLITDARSSVGSPASLHRHGPDPGPPTRIRHTGLREKVR